MNWINLLSPKRFGDKTDIELSHETRSRFEQDFDRLIFSHPFRRLQDKTQVFPLPEDDFVHTRLTHSLEVSSVGRSLGKAVGEKVIAKYSDLQDVGYTFHDFGGIVAAASLAHDLGNPPFGHSGETAISAFFMDNEKGNAFQKLVSDKEWQDLISFEGNAQGFRILNDEAHGGLRLTYASLGAFTKYPKTSFAKKDSSRKSQKKYGIYRSELSYFRMMTETMQIRKLDEETWVRHPLAFLVEAADDICYGIIDLEDGTRLGLVDFEVTKGLLARIIGESFNEEKLNKIPGQNEKLGLLRAMTIGKLIQESVDVFLANEEQMLSGEFDQALTDLIPSAAILSEISALSVKKIYRAKQVLERETGGFEIIGKLMEAFCLGAYQQKFNPNQLTNRQKTVLRLLPESISLKIQKEGLTTYELLLIIMDFISSLTDSHAIKLYKIIHGFSLPISKA
ncbi:deoxyguanosinetriphosphate triphosphohydrolase [Marinoscillum sp. MHG1-6]|uniref:deoxyguanosinetriphosphate triphosphohydrolase n=1 Tax=Marinoscillum sp. MHG1-6 TaxID=2959627 RepID=UPI00215825CD|nr:deoxyguanosinetriphosphate triphosphohydrolase [Marinoscillum sp. MHG1-6]